jgi:ankyrin repeat protein
VVELLLKNGVNADTKTSSGSSLLMTAAERGYTSVVRMLLQKWPDLNATDDSGLTPLMLATKGGHAEVIELLLESDADPSTGDPEGRKAIHFAAEHGDLTTIQLFLDCPNVEVNETDSSGRTPLHIAVETKTLNVVKLFLQKGTSATTEDKDRTSPLDLEASEELMEILLASTNLDEMADPSRVLDKALRQAAMRGYLRVIKDLHSHDADLKTLDESGRSLYHLAAKSGCAEVIKLLYELNVPGFGQADNAKRTPASYASENGHLAATQLLAETAPDSVRQPDENDRTPLSYAAACQEFGVAEYLLESTGAVGDVNTADSGSRTPLWFAAEQGLTPIVQALLRHQANPNIADTDRASTPLHHATRVGIREMVNLLLGSKASIDVQDVDGRTPLYQAAWSKHTEVVSIFIDRDAPDTPDNSGWRVLHAAYDSPEVLKLLLTKPYVEVNSAEVDGITALHLAVIAGYSESVNVLLCSGADPLKQDCNGITPLHMAATYNANDEVFSLLLQNAKGPLDAKDNRDRTPLVAAIEDYNRSAVELLLKTGQFVLGDVGKEEKSALDVALEANSGGVIDLILRHSVANISTESIEKILVWALKNHQKDVKEQTMQILRDRNTKALAESNTLFVLATKTDDTHLAKFLLSLGSDPEMRDEHGWTLSQVVTAYEPPADISLSLDDKHSPPSRWSAAHSSHNAGVSEENGLWLRSNSNSASIYVETFAARSDHPISLSRRFYFEIDVIKGNEER